MLEESKSAVEAIVVADEEPAAFVASIVAKKLESRGLKRVVLMPATQSLLVAVKASMQFLSGLLGAGRRIARFRAGEDGLTPLQRLGSQLPWPACRVLRDSALPRARCRGTDGTQIGARHLVWQNQQHW